MTTKFLKKTPKFREFFNISSQGDAETVEELYKKLATTARFARLRCSLRLQGDISDLADL